MPRYIRNGDVITVPDVLAGQYEQRGWVRYKDAPPARPLKAYTKKELEALAESRGVNLAGAKTKADMIAALTGPPK